jgi:hypothetical protein
MALVSKMYCIVSDVCDIILILMYSYSQVCLIVPRLKCFEARACRAFDEGQLPDGQDDFILTPTPSPTLTSSLLPVLSR